MKAQKTKIRKTNSKNMKKNIKKQKKTQLVKQITFYILY